MARSVVSLFAFLEMNLKLFALVWLSKIRQET